MNDMNVNRTTSPALKALPNCITALRIVGTAVLLFMGPFTGGFYVLYGLCGFSDVLDGWVARRMGTTSQLGSKLDSIADLLLYTLILLRIFPVLKARLPGWIWYMVWSTVGFRVLIYGMAGVKYHKFASIHTYMNKVCGLTIFLVPYFIMSAAAAAYCTLVCVVALLAALEEFVIYLSSPSYPLGIHTIFQLKKKQ